MFSAIDMPWKDIDGNSILDTEGNEIYIKYDDAIIEKIRLCTMTVVEAPYQNSSLITLTCQDNMMKFDRDYSESKLEYPATRGRIIRDACSICGVPLQTVVFDNDDYIVESRPDDENLTFRQLIAWVAQIGGQWCKCDTYGRLCIGWYDLKSYENNVLPDGKYISINSYDTLSVNNEDVVITGIRVTEYKDDATSENETVSYQYGKDGYVIEIKDNKLISSGKGNEIATMIGERIVGMRFRPFTASITNNPAIEAGDICLITDRKGNTYKSFITTSTFQVGNKQSVGCGAKSAVRNSVKQYSLYSQAIVENRKNLQKERTNRELALEELSKRLSNASGLYSTVEENNGGGNVYYLHNKFNLEESDIVWKMTAEAWGVSTDGGQTWNGGMTVDGDTITRILDAVGIRANWINTGEFRVADEKNNEMFYVNCDTGVVRIKAQQFSLTGESVEEIANKEIDKFVSNIYKTDLEEIKKQLSDKIETWYQDSDPSLQWTGKETRYWYDEAGHPILDIDGYPILITVETEKEDHEGDLWKNPKNNNEYIYRSGNWELMDVPDSVFDEIDGKAQIFIKTPTTPYNVGDAWFTGTDILTCLVDRDSGEFVASDWEKKNNYTDDSALNKFLTGDYSETIEEIKTQVDGKAETWRQDTDPSTAWTTDALKAQHKGDLWYKTSEQKSYIYSGTAWTEMKTNPPDIVFDAIDGKAQIFSTQPKPPYSVSDLYFTGNEILVCKKDRETGEYEASDWEKKDNYTDDSKVTNFIENVYDPKIADIQNQIDGKIDTFYYDYEPTMSNAPASGWTTDAEKNKHNGDLFFWKSKGYTYRFLKANNTWQWVRVKDADITSAMTAASNAQDTADGKRRAFTTTPTPPYDVGDLWTQGSTGDLMRCKTSRASGNYVSTDWIKATKYTDDSSVDKLEQTVKSEFEVIDEKIALRVTVADAESLIEQKARSIRLQADEISWKSKYSEMTEDGTLTCENATIKGTLYSENGENKTYLRNGYMQITYKSQNLGLIGGNGLDGYTDIEGLNFDLEYTGDYMTWAAKNYSNSKNYAMKLTYARSSFGKMTADALNAGCDIDMHGWKIKNPSFEGGGVTATVNYVQITGIDDYGKITGFNPNAQSVYRNGILVGLRYS